MSSSDDLYDAQADAPMPPPDFNVRFLYRSYHTSVKRIFSNIIAGRLREASTTALDITSWLLSYVASLERTTLANEHAQLWVDFNHKWQGVFQRQSEMLALDPLSYHPPEAMTPETVDAVDLAFTRIMDVIHRSSLPSLTNRYLTPAQVTAIAQAQFVLAALNLAGATITECLEVQVTIETSGGLGV